MKKKLLFILFNVSCVAIQIAAQPSRWQQRVKYEMEIDFDATKHQFKGKQKLHYTNNSPDTLTKVFYHLYLNAFQPGSLMDVRSRRISDPDKRVTDRISKLKPNEIGYEKILSLRHNGAAIEFKVEGTILEVRLAKPILPNTTTLFEMEFEGQVPVQIRRTGRDNSEGIDYSMAQWYPKMSEYDYEGWHPTPYVGREFYGVWGDYDVKIKMDAAYTIAATGYLKNADEIGHGYSQKEVAHESGEKITWHFEAPEVHDFVWAADTAYQHDIVEVDKDLSLHFFYVNDTINHWKEVEPKAVQCFQLMNGLIGRYPYKQYSIIQGGDGGMEYPMATLIMGRGSAAGLLSVTVHESIHSWFQMLLGTNESKFAWMDEGFTTYATNVVLGTINATSDPQKRTYAAYRQFVKSGLEEPMTTHADHFNTNAAYSVGSYIKGAVFLNQLSYIIGAEAFDTGMKHYFAQWKFKHPNPTDLRRIMEKVSGLQLDWYWDDWVGTTKTVDYAIETVKDTLGKTQVTLSKIGQVPMPLDVVVTYTDGSLESFYIPLDLLRGEKKEKLYSKTTLLADWGWANPEYTFPMDKALKSIKKVEIDPSGRLADIDLSNNIFIANPNANP